MTFPSFVALSGLHLALAITFQTVLASVVAFSVHLNRRAWRAWSFLLLSVFANALLVAGSRLVQWGPWIATDLRYLTDFAWLVPLAVCFAFAPQVLPSQQERHPPESLVLSPRFRPRVIVAVVALLAYLGIAASTTAKLQREWGGHLARRWEARVQSGVAKLRARGETPVIADGIVPWFMIDTRFVGVNQLSAVLPLYVRDAHVDGVIDGPLVTVEPTGSVRPATVTSSLGTTDPQRLRSHQQLQITNAASTFTRADHLCVGAGRTPANLVVQAPSRASSQRSNPEYLLLSYTTAQPGGLPLAVDTGQGGWAGTPGLPVAAGRHSSIRFLGSSIKRVLLQIPPADTICIKRLNVGTLTH